MGVLVATGCQPVSGTPNPTASPSVQPSAVPSSVPTSSPTPKPTAAPTATPTVSPRPSTAANETVCAGSTTLSGLDVSNYQAGANWTKVAGTGKSFAFVKATEGVTYMNPSFPADWSAVAQYGMVRGAYHYFYPQDDPIVQADYFLTTVGNLTSTDLPPVLDWEETGSLSNAKDIANAVTWLERVSAATGKTPMIYVGVDFLNTLGNPAGLIGYPLFIAGYDRNCPSIPPPWSGWAFWQSSQSGSISGIAGSVDLDTFNGNAADLKLFANTGIY